MPETIVENSVERIFQYGVLGILVVVFGYVIWTLWKTSSTDRKETEKARETEREKFESERKAFETTLSSVYTAHAAHVERLQQLRIEDAKTYQAQLVDLTKGATAAMTNVSQHLDRNKEALEETTEAIRDIGDDIRRRP